MVYPTVVFWAEEGKPTQKASIVFLSDDLSHDHQQVKKMEERAKDILEEKTGLKFNKIIRGTDGCGAQFKSGYCTADLVSSSMRMLNLSDGTVIYFYFASNEGKSESDTTGSNFKMRIEGMLLKNPRLVVTCAAELVDAYTKFVETKETNRYKFCLVEEIKPFARVPSNEREKITIQGITKLHQITYHKGGLKFDKLSCLACLRLQEECSFCASQPFNLTPAEVKQKHVREGRVASTH